MKKNITLRMYPEVKTELENRFGGIQKFLDKCIEKELGKITKQLVIKKEVKK